MRKAYSYRLKRDIVLLNDQEFAPIGGMLRDVLKSIMAYRKTYNVGLDEAAKKNVVGQAALATYEKLTGLRLNGYLALYHVSLSKYGRLCPSCEKPFRTPRAKICAECGYTLPEGEVAGPLADE